MDFQRILILAGLAVTTYMLVLAWNEDYGEKAVEALPELEGEMPPTPAGVEAELPVPSEADEIPAATEIATDVPAAAPAEAPPQAAERRFITVRTDVLELIIDLAGGDIERASLPAYPEKIETPDTPFTLVDPRNDYALQSGLVGPNGTDGADGRPLFSAGKDVFELTGDELLVDLTLPAKDGVDLTKRFRLRRGDYLVTLEYLVDNRSDAPWSAALYGQVKRNGQTPVFEDQNVMGLQPFVGGATFQPESPYTKLEFDDVAETPYRERVQGGYMALVQHYFLSAWIPDSSLTHTYSGRRLANRDVYLFGFTSPLSSVAPGSTSRLAASIYIGPKDQYRLAEISPGLDLTVDYGFLWWLAQPLFDLLNLIHGFVNNWGVAIILLTVIVKTLLYPLSAASFRSMAKMRKLQPEMQRLKERFGDDRQQFSQAMMDLYKKEGANPLGGCFPILLQMPVFLALYWALLESVELRQAPFMLWIDDLSAMDPYFVLPILMGVSMFLTQMLQPEPPDPVQARVFKMMPILFTFFFLWFPSGLVLYWLVNNILSILQQWYVTRQIEKSA